MAKSIIDTEQLKIAKRNLNSARKQLTGQGSNSIIPSLNGIIARLEGSDIWQGDACEAYLIRLREQRDSLVKLESTLRILESHCYKVDTNLESYIRYVQSLLGMKF